MLPRGNLASECPLAGARPPRATLSTDAIGMELLSCCRGNRGRRDCGRRRRWLAGLILAAGSVLAVDAGSSSAADTLTPLAVPQAAPIQAIETEDALLSAGLEMEGNRQWAEAIQHYESAMRKFTSSRQLYQRLLISRLRYDVNRRFDDHSYLASVRELSTSQALDLYSEVLANLKTHYVEDVDWARVLLHGTAALEVALDESCFVNTMLPNADAEEIERFRLSVHHELRGRSTQTRFDLRSSVKFVAEIAHRELGLAGTATVLEFLSGAVSTLDPYTRLLSGSQLDEMNSNIEGNFVGLGIELKAGENCLEILSVIPGGPAAEAGIQPGEKIIAVERSSAKEFDPDYVADLLRGPENSRVAVRIQRNDGAIRDLSVPRRRVDVPCVENIHLVDTRERVGYFRLTSFQRTTRHEVEQALAQLNQQGMRSLIIDVRGNPGGLLTAAVEVADRFLDSGAILMTRGRNPKENYDYTAHRPGTWRIPLVVLIDNNSASASEIFAGAMADRGRATIVGSTSYGKGSVQGVFELRTAKFGLCLTSAKFYSPSGTAISQRGVSPHVLVDKSYITARPDDEGNMVTDLDDAALQQGLTQLTSVTNTLVSRRP